MAKYRDSNLPASPLPTLRSRPTSSCDFFTGYRVNEHIPGYTGFIPRLQNDFARSYTPATRAALMWPPTTEVDEINWDFKSHQRRLRSRSPLLGVLNWQSPILYGK